jgi:hypothetical protein
LPLATRLVGGVGFHAGRAIVCVALARRPSGEDGPHMSHAVILGGAALGAIGGEVGWAIAVDETFRFVHATALARGAADERLPSWIGRARTDDGRTIGWIDGAAMLADVAGVPV